MYAEVVFAMIVVCTGGRYYRDVECIFSELDFLCPDEVYVGDCVSGADAIVRDWCRERGVRFLEFRAHWAQEGRKAGPLRNERMVMASFANSGGRCVGLVFPGGAGTLDCRARMEFIGMSIREVT
jgi:hypothetical protein